MSAELQESVEKLGLQDPKIYVGRERIYPPREGLTPSPKAIATFKQALLSPESVKGSVRIMDGEQVLFKMAKGQVEVPLSPEQVKAALVFDKLPEPSATTVASAEPELPIEPAPVNAQTQTEQENAAARDTYFDLLKQHPEFKDLDVTTRDELLDRPTAIQQKGDRQVSEMALERGLPREEVDRVMGQGSPYIQKELEAGSLSAVQGYLTERSVDYQQRLDAQTATKEAAIPEASAVAPDAARENDFPEEATNHAAPVQGFAATMQTQLESAQVTALQAKATLELAQKNLSTFAKAVKHRGFKAWAADQMPILKQKAKEIAIEQGTKVKDWAREQAPIVKEVAIHAATKIGEQAFEKGKDLGAKAWEKFEKATQLVDSATLDPALKDVIGLFGKNGQFAGEEFNFQQTKTGVDVHLKDGTPVYTDGKLNPQVDGRFTFRLSKIPENVAKVRADISQQVTTQQYQRKLVESRGFSR